MSAALAMLLFCNYSEQYSQNRIFDAQTVDKTLLVSTPEAFFLFSVQKVCT